MNQIRPGTPSASSQAEQPRNELEADLAIMARLEGKPLPTVQDLARMFDVSQTTAFRIVSRFKQSGILRLVDQVRLPDSICHSIVDLRTRMSNARIIAELEARLRSDPHIAAAAAVTGPHSYRIRGLHASTVEANAWFKALLSEPAVIDGRIIFCRPILERQSYASALLNGRPHG